MAELIDAVMSNRRACNCSSAGPHNATTVRNIGIDKTNGRFGNASVQRCGGCGQLWLRYFVEYEGFSGSARWAEVPVDDATAGAILPNKAAAYIDTAPWHIRGGSYWGGTPSRGSGPLRWDL